MQVQLRIDYFGAFKRPHHRGTVRGRSSVVFKEKAH
jgi:hypothetical protein